MHVVQSSNKLNVRLPTNFYAYQSHSKDKSDLITLISFNVPSYHTHFFLVFTLCFLELTTVRILIY